MKSRYLLYLDILGFSDLVEKDPEKVGPLYHAISKMRAHEHGDFQTIVFSDTVLVYNKAIPRTVGNHTYLVMFLCEFAQHLMLSLRGSGIYFRGLLTHGEFEHYRLGKAECFYGKGLINAYKREKAIKSIGLFIDRHCEARNVIFDTTNFNGDLRFVFLTQNIGRLAEVSAGGFPIDPILLEEMDTYCLLCEIQLLEDTRRQMQMHPLPEVRQKFASAWESYKSTYPQVICALEAQKFRPEFICPSHDWTTYDLDVPSFAFPPRLKDNQWGFTFTFEVKAQGVDYSNDVARTILEALGERKFCGTCECYEDEATFSDSTRLYRISLGLRRSSGREFKDCNWWEAFQKDLEGKLSQQSLPIEITHLSELSSMESIRASLRLSGVVSFDDGKPQSIVCSQDGAEETSFLTTAKGANYWRKS